ncbi:MAG TPA: YlxR family protein [Limnochordales bacterium]
MKPRKVPQRTCVGCRQVRAKRELVRVVRTPDGQVTVDTTGKLAGRGAYVCPDPNCLELAWKGRRLERALQHPVPDEVRQRLAEMLAAAAP